MLPWLGSVFRVLGVWGLSGLGSPQNTNPNLLTLDLEFWLGLGLLELGDGLTVRV